MIHGYSCHIKVKYFFRKIIYVGHIHEHCMIDAFRKFALTSFCLFFLYGCVSFIPIPVFTGTVISGSKITDENITFLSTGRTTREEVIQKLGQPSMEFKDLHIIVYSWIIRIGYMAPDFIDIPQEHVLLVALDEKDIVLNYEISIKPWPFDTIRGHTLRWIEREQIDVPKPSDKFIPLEIPQGQSVIYIFRSEGHEDVSMLHPAVSIDSKLVAELRKGGYIASVLQPGIHQISVDPVPKPWGYEYILAKRRPIRTVSLNVLSDTDYYLIVRIKPGDVIESELTTIPEEEALPVINNLRPTW